MNVDKYFTREYNKDSYNCAHFVCEIWSDLYGVDLSEKLLPLLKRKSQRHVTPKLRRDFIRLESAVEPCIVLFHRRYCDPHVGIYINGGVLHLTEIRVELVPLKIAMLSFDTVRFYK